MKSDKAHKMYMVLSKNYFLSKRTNLHELLVFFTTANDYELFPPFKIVL